MANYKVRLRNEDLIRLIVQLSEQLEASTVSELINSLENGGELGFNIIVKKNINVRA
jgi:hypothetical protein